MNSVREKVLQIELRLGEMRLSGSTTCPSTVRPVYDYHLGLLRGGGRRGATIPPNQQDQESSPKKPVAKLSPRLRKRSNTADTEISLPSTPPCNDDDDHNNSTKRLEALGSYEDNDEFMIFRSNPSTDEEDNDDDNNDCQDGEEDSAELALRINHLSLLSFRSTALQTQEHHTPDIGVVSKQRTNRRQRRRSRTTTTTTTRKHERTMSFSFFPGFRSHNKKVSRQIFSACQVPPSIVEEASQASSKSGKSLD